MSNADIDRQVTDHMAYLIRQGEAPATIGEISDELAVSVNRVRPSIKRLVAYGEVREAGVGTNGAKTWTLAIAPQAAGQPCPPHARRHPMTQPRIPTELAAEIARHQREITRLLQGIAEALTELAHASEHGQELLGRLAATGRHAGEKTGERA